MGTETTAATETPANLPASADAILAAKDATAGLINLPAGVELNEAQAQKMEAEKSVRLIVVAGAIDCGKTTLLSSIYEMFQLGPIDKKQFAGCDTFPAFEKKCHLGRTDSGNQEEDTVRNAYEGPNPEYVHLKLQNGAKALGHIEFLFTDVSGEMFEHARNSTDECKKLEFLRRAAHVLIFLDCDKLLQPTKRWGMIKDARSLIQSCLDSEMLSPDCFVTVVWAKVDMIEAAKGKDNSAAKELMEQVEHEFREAFGDRIKNLKFHRTAARPNFYPALKFGFGVHELMDDWVMKTLPTSKSDGVAVLREDAETSALQPPTPALGSPQ